MKIPVEKKKSKENGKLEVHKLLDEHDENLEKDAVLNNDILYILLADNESFWMHIFFQYALMTVIIVTLLIHIIFG